MTKPVKVKDTLLGAGLPKICVPVTATRREDILNQTWAAKNAGADLVEWRADFFAFLENKDMAIETLCAAAGILGRIPLLFTIRTKAEGGNRDLLLEDYINFNLLAAKTKKADLIDVEFFGEEKEKKALIRSLQKEGAKVVASSHDFEKTDQEELLLKRFCDMEASGADLLKIAVMPKSFQDVAAIMEATKEMKKRTEKPLISMSMGSMGSISRISGESFGSCLTFGTVGEASAPGQFPIEDLRVMIKAIHRQMPGKEFT